MNDSERQALEELHRKCTAALGKYLKEATEMCRVLSAVKHHPASGEERRLLLEQRVKETRRRWLICPYGRHYSRRLAGVKALKLAKCIAKAEVFSFGHFCATMKG